MCSVFTAEPQVYYRQFSFYLFLFVCTFWFLFLREKECIVRRKGCDGVSEVVLPLNHSTTIYHTELQTLGMLGAALHFELQGVCSLLLMLQRQLSTLKHLKPTYLLKKKKKNHHSNLSTLFCIQQLSSPPSYRTGSSKVLLSPPEQTGGTCCPSIPLSVRQNCTFLGHEAELSFQRKLTEL